MKIILIFLASASVLCFSGCGKSDQDKATEQQIEKSKTSKDIMEFGKPVRPNAADYKGRV